MRTRAIILKKQNTGEYDQLVTCYTEEFGKLTAVAKSILKPRSIQALHLDTFNLVDFDLVTGKVHPIIAGAQAERAYGGIKSSLESLSRAYFFIEVADRLFFEYQKDTALWDFFESTLNDLDQGQIGLFRKKQVEFMDILGYAPNFEECAPNSLKLIRNMIE